MEDMTIQGLGNVLDRMRELPPRLQRNGLTRAMRRGANVVRDAARANARAIDDPESREAIWRNIVTSTSPRQSRREGGVVMRVGVRGGAKSGGAGGSANPGGDTWYWRLLELGFRHIRGNSKIPGNQFMQRALAANTTRATNVIVDNLKKEIDKELAKMRIGQ